MKRLLSALLCASIAMTSLFIPTTASALGTNKTSEGDFRDGSIVQCGNYIVSAVSNVKKNKLKIYRTTLKGKKAKLIASTKIYSGVPLLTYADKVYYRKGEKVISYNPKTEETNTLFKPESDEKLALLGICSKGIIYKDSLYSVRLYKFDGTTSDIAYDGYTNTEHTYLGATDEYIFYYKQEDNVGNRQVLRLYRYSFETDKSQKMGKFKTAKKSNIPNYGTFHAFKKKLVFTALSDNSGSLYSMNKDGTAVKRLKEGDIGSVLMPGKSGVYLTAADAKNNYYIYKVSSKGKVTTALKYSGSYSKPMICYTTATGRALGISASKKQEFGYNLYTLSKPKKLSGKKIFEADRFVKKSDYGYILVTPSVSGSAGDMVLVTYGVYRYDNKGYFEKTYRCKTYLVNVKTGKKTLIDE